MYLIDSMFLCGVFFLQQHSSVCLQIAAALCITNLIDKNEDGKQINYQQDRPQDKLPVLRLIRD